MSRITNPRWTPGSVITKTGTEGVDTKFAAFETATATINADNVRSEGVDVGNIYSAPADTGKSSDVAKSIVVTFAGFEKAGATTTAVANAQAALELEQVSTVAAGNPLTLRTTDVLRVYWQIQLGNITDSPWPSGFRPQNSTVHTASGNAKLKDASGGLMWLIWPQYQTSSGGSWANFSNQPDPETNTQVQADTSNTVMPIPHIMYNQFWINQGGTGPNTGTPLTVPPAKGGTDGIEAVAKASWCRGCFWTPTQDTQIWAIRIVIRGLYRMTTSGSVGSQVTRFDYASALGEYTGAGGVAPNVQKINVCGRSLGVIAMRKS